jgi:hypothetical protein
VRRRSRHIELVSIYSERLKHPLRAAAALWLQAQASQASGALSRLSSTSLG